MPSHRKRTFLDLSPEQKHAYLDRARAAGITDSLYLQIFDHILNGASNDEIVKKTGRKGGIVKRIINEGVDNGYIPARKPGCRSEKRKAAELLEPDKKERKPNSEAGRKNSLTAGLRPGCIRRSFVIRKEYSQKIDEVSSDRPFWGSRKAFINFILEDHFKRYKDNDSYPQKS